MKGKSKKLVTVEILALISVVWVLLTTLFHFFWEPPRPLWVAQFMLIGIVLMIVWGIAIGIALLVAKLSQYRTRG